MDYMDIWTWEGGSGTRIILVNNISYQIIKINVNSCKGQVVNQWGLFHVAVLTNKTLIRIKK